MKTKLIPLIVIVSIVVGGFIFLPAFRGSRSPEETKGYGPDILMWGKSISLQEAVELVPFPIILPEYIPDSLRLVDVRIMIGDGGPLIGLVYQPSKLPENALLGRDMIGGGILVIEGYHGCAVEYTEQLIKDSGEGSIRIRGSWKSKDIWRPSSMRNPKRKFLPTTAS
jgi:hypothetical protein